MHSKQILRLHATGGAANPAYVSVSVPNLSDKMLSHDGADDILEPGILPPSLYRYVERTLIHCKGGPLELANMKVSDLSYIQLSGKLPGFNFLYALEILKPSNNKFVESIPNNLLKGDPLVLIELDLSQQSFRADKHDRIYNFEHP